MNYKKLRLQNSRVYQDITVPLTKQGLVAIHGANGVGKSTLWDILEEIHYEATPDRHKKDDLVRNKKDALFEVEYDHEGSSYSVTHKRVKKKWKYEVTKDGVDITPHTYDDAKKLVRKLIPLSQPEFQGAVHLTQGSQHLLITGQPGDRNKYISNFFGLSDLGFEKLHASAKEELEKADAEITRVEKLVAQKEMLEQQLQQLPDVDIEPLNTEINQASNSLLQIEEFQLELMDAVKKAELYNKHAAEASKFADPELDLANLNDSISQLESEIKSAEERRRYNAEASRANSQIAQLKSSLEQVLRQHPGVDKVDTQVYFNLRTRFEQHRQSEGLLKEYAGIENCLTAVPTDELEKTVSEMTVHASQRQHTINAIAQGKCPTCGAEYSSQQLEVINKELSEYLMYLEAAKTDLHTLKERNRVAKRKMDLETIVSKLNPLSVQELADFALMTKLVEVKPTYEQVVSQLSVMTPRELLPVVESLSTSMSEVQALKIKRDDVQRCLIAKRQLPEGPICSLDDVKQQLQVADNDWRLWEAKRNDLFGKIGMAQNQARAKSSLKSQVDGLASQVSCLPKLITDQMFWKKMADAYGPKGLKVKHLSNIMDMVISRLPYYAGVLFQEQDLRFTHSCDSDSIHIIANRTDAEGDFCHDVSSFSGGEKKRMSVALVLTLADCVPAFKRSNLLILDEVDDALDAIGQYRFVNDLLPMLKSDYESVFVISHAEEVKQAAVYDQVWKITKDRHVSTIDRQEVLP
jgi:DNA repair exonuclease SbcCD ATPase subunit